MGQYPSGTTAREPEGKKFEVIPAGVYPARCFQVIDLGVQEMPFKDDDDMPITQAKVMLGFEVIDPTVKREDGKPYVVTAEFTNSLSEKANLRKFLEGWRNKDFTPEELQGFELAKVIGVYCQVQVKIKITKSGNEFPEIVQVIPYQPNPGEGQPPAINPNLHFSLEDDKFDADMLAQLPKFIQDKVKKSLTYRYDIEPRLNGAANAKHDLPPAKRSNDVVIEDIGDDPVNLDDIPF